MFASRPKRLPVLRATTAPRAVALRRAACLAAAGCLLVSGCSSGDDEAASATSPSASATETSATGTSATGTSAVEGTQDLPARLTPVVESTMTDLVIPGTVVLVRTPDSEWFEAFGTRVVGTDEPVTVDDHFRVGSNTKTMTGTVLLQLVQEGEVALEDPVSKYRPDIPNGDNITIAQILDMTSGLYNYSELPEFNARLDNDPGYVWEPAELLELGLAEPPYFPPGEGFHYSNTNYVLAGLIIEEVTGQDYITAVRQRIFDPLELADTSIPPQDVATLPDPHPNGYQFGTNVSTLDSARLPDDQIAAARAGELLPNDVTTASPSWTWAAGAAISTAEDLATYVEALVAATPPLLDDALQQQRLDSLVARNPDDPQSPRYGLALASFGPMIGHDGTTPGYQTFMGYDPERDITLVVLCNLTDGPEGTGGSANQIAKNIIAELYPS
ncbi:serine hydrolase domain-containing protein [Rhodococcus chondri]|uniref:Serine hydrolase domain-containing protein n=1 Tax=Rhodococcus chondri TaxID=3065941 RepID=A0ABU7JU09_9NOCA|nr:serine hydrolase domain-containing protein [Rhodococcus sp. CC-R104]MEE2033515.1 serine hydrolase domain-containing protein [Rhodococcus sp. CC-R104]